MFVGCCHNAFNAPYCASTITSLGLEAETRHKSLKNAPDTSVTNPSVKSASIGIGSSPHV